MMRSALLLLALLSAPPNRGADNLESLTKLESDLLALQQRLRAGELVPQVELELGKATREHSLTGLDFKKALEMGMEPSAARAKLEPGLAAELQLLADQRSALDVGPPREPSPLLTMVLDFEQELKSAADRRRQRLGIKSPLDSTALSQRITADAPKPADLKAGDPKAAPLDPTALISEPRLRGSALYRTGRYADALAAWQLAKFPEGAAGDELEHQRADCLLKIGKTAEAITIWERIATDRDGTPIGAQAEFSLKVAHAMAALELAKAGSKKPGGGP